MADEEDDDELRTRRARFLDVQTVGTRYQETSIKGEITTYDPYPTSLELAIENLIFHTKIDAASGAVRPLVRGETRERFRAIGTEGEYQIFNVTISSEIDPSAAIIKKVYATDGHNLESSMVIGLTDDAIRALREATAGTLHLAAINGLPIYGRDYFPRLLSHGAVVLSHWREHIVEGGEDSEKVVVEWRFTFATATLSPKGYSRFLSFHHHAGEEVRLASEVGIFFRPGSDHPLRPTFEELRT